MKVLRNYKNKDKRIETPFGEGAVLYLEDFSRSPRYIVKLDVDPRTYNKNEYAFFKEECRILKGTK